MSSRNSLAMRFLGRRLSTAHVLAGVAIVISSVGSATAAVMITGASVKDSSLTGRDLRNGSVSSADIRNRSLTGTDVKDGSIASQDLAPSARGQIGPPGPAGAPGRDGTNGQPGATGAEGATGPRGPAGPIGLPIFGFVSNFVLPAKTVQNPWMTIPGPATRIVSIPSAGTIVDGSLTVGLGSSSTPLRADVNLCYRANADDPPIPFNTVHASVRLATNTSVPIAHETTRTFTAGTWRIAPCIRHDPAVPSNTEQSVDLGGASSYRLVVDPTY